MSTPRCLKRYKHYNIKLAFFNTGYKRGNYSHTILFSGMNFGVNDKSQKFLHCSFSFSPGRTFRDNLFMYVYLWRM